MKSLTLQNRLSVTVISLILAVSLVVPAASAAPDRGDLFMAGQLALQRGDHVTAVRRFEAHWRMAQRHEADAWRASLALAGAHESRGDRAAGVATLLRYIDHAQRHGWGDPAAQAHQRRAGELVAELRVKAGFVEAYDGVRRAVVRRPEGPAASAPWIELRGGRAAGAVLDRVAGPGWSTVIQMALGSTSGPDASGTRPSGG